MRKPARGRLHGMKYRLVVFDFDGTLADSFPFLVSVGNMLADRFHFRRITEEEIPTLRTYDIRRIMKHVGLPVWRVPLLVASFHQLMAESIHQIPLFQGIDELLGLLRERGLTLAVVSSNTDENVRRVLSPRNEALVSYFECGAAVFGKRARLRKVAKKSGFARHEILCIGDETRDIDAARAEGMAAAAVSWGYAAPSALAARAPVELFTSPTEIAAKLLTA
jgi:phosphoglycolate phosphatase